MIELIYPMDSVPVFPPKMAGDIKEKDAVKENKNDQRAEMFPVVEPSGIVTAMATREYCHGGSKILHPVVHLHIIDRYSRLYLQKRSIKKDIQPGKWDTAVGGHVNYGEMIHEALFREAYEELRLREFNPVYIGSYEFESEVEKELVNVFAAVGSFELKPDAEEVDDGCYWDVTEIDESLGKSVFTPNFEAEYRSIRNTLLALL